MVLNRRWLDQVSAYHKLRLFAFAIGVAIFICNAEPSKVAAAKPGLTKLAWMKENFNASAYGFPDCMPYPHQSCPWPVAPGARGGYVTYSACTRCMAKLRQQSSDIRVACVGDSITAGVDASSREMTYPSQLQRLLGDGYVVTNLGSSGATMQAAGPRPYVQTAMYRALLENEWDVVVLMLGTNDGRPADPMKDECDPHAFLDQPCKNLAAAMNAWKKGISPKAYYEDAADIVREVRASAEAAQIQPPRIFVMTPPPIVHDRTSGVKRTIVNEVVPNILELVAQDLDLPPPIELHAPFGGSDLECPPVPVVEDPLSKDPCRFWWGCHPHWPSPYDGKITHPSGVICDMLHPSDAGYTVIAQEVHTRIKSGVVQMVES